MAVQIGNYPALTVKNANDYIKVDNTNTYTSREITLNKELIEWIGEGKLEDITIYGISDIAGNVLQSYTFKNKIYVDATAPVIEKIEITGGLASENNNVIYVDPSAKDIKVKITTNECLSKKATIDIGKKSYQISTYSTNNGKYIYEVSLKCSSILDGNNLTKNACIPVKIRDYADKAGNAGSARLVNYIYKSSNGIYLYYGGMKGGTVYIAANHISGTTDDEDVDKDGFITKFDSLLALKATVNVTKVVNNKNYKFVDFDKDKKYTAADALYVNRKASNTVKLKVGAERTFKFYDEDLNLLTGDELITFKVEDKNGKEIYSSNSEIDITKNRPNGTIKLKAKTTSLEKIKIKVEYQKDHKGDIKTGTMVLQIVK